MKKIVLFLAVLCLFFVGCKKDSTIQEQIDFGYQYFPLNVGDSSFFQVDQIVWNDFDHTIDTNSYILCEFIESYSTNLAGDSMYRIERLKKSVSTDSWQLDSVWFALKNSHEAIRVENNRTYVKMVFPINENQSWNENIYNIYPEKIALCTALASANVNGLNYAHAAFIELQNFVTLINSDVETEIYGEQVGLIQLYKYHVYKEYNAISGQFEIKSGYRYTQSRIH